MKIYKITFEAGAVTGCAPLSPNTHIVRHWPGAGHFTLARGSKHVTMHLSAEDFDSALERGKQLYITQPEL